jgi:rhodanese-related sulfurtransferase
MSAADPIVTCGVDELLAAARARLDRLTPEQAARAAVRGALLIDTRTETQRAEHGEVTGAIVIDRTVLEWRLDPRSPWCIPEVTSPDIQVIVLCRQGYSSSVAAASLQSVGLLRATDVIGGVEAWAAAGLAMHRGAADVRR